MDKLPRRVSGYNLDELLPEKGFNVARALVGTESTCVTVLRATLMLTPAMLQRVTVVVHYDDIAAAGDHVTEIIGRFRPIGLEAIDQQLIEDQRLSGRTSATSPSCRTPIMVPGCWCSSGRPTSRPRPTRPTPSPG